MQSATVTVRKVPGRGGHPAVDALDLGPAAAGADGHDLGAMDLIAQGERLGPRQRLPEGAPAAHDLADRRVGPEAEIEPAAGVGRPAR